jgi:hypothetical protein
MKRKGKGKAMVNTIGLWIGAFAMGAGISSIICVYLSNRQWNALNAKYVDQIKRYYALVHEHEALAVEYADYKKEVETIKELKGI